MCETPSLVHGNWRLSHELQIGNWPNFTAIDWGKGDGDVCVPTLQRDSCFTSGLMLATTHKLNLRPEFLERHSISRVHRFDTWAVCARCLNKIYPTLSALCTYSREEMCHWHQNRVGGGYQLDARPNLNFQGNFLCKSRFSNTAYVVRLHPYNPWSLECFNGILLQTF